MEFSEQFTLLDIVVYIFIGALFLAIGGLFWWHFTGMNLIALIPNNTWISAFLFISIPYLLGVMFSEILFPYMLKVAFFTKPELPKTWRSLGSFLFGMKGESDPRTEYINEHPLFKDRLQSKLTSTFEIGEWKEDEENDEKTIYQEKRELFYVVLRYVNNFSLAIGAHAIERRMIISNVYSGLALFFILTFVLSFASALLSTFARIGILSAWTLAVMAGLALICAQIVGRKFQRSIRLWIHNVWRAFLVVEEPNEEPEKTTQ